MKSLTTLKNLFGSLSTNQSAANLTLGGQLIDDQHRYLIQKYFDNERTAFATTVGGGSLTTTGSLASGATTATLTVAWAYATCTQLVNFSNGNQRLVSFTNSSTAISWSVPLSATATTALTTVGVQAYPIAANVSKVVNDTINVGQLKYVCTPIMGRAEWDSINFLPYTSDIPLYYYIYAGKLEIFPIPSTTGNILSFNYKTRVPNLTYADYSTGNLANGTGMVAGSYAVAGNATSWANTTFPIGVDISYLNLFIRADAPYGDGIWYPIKSFTDASNLVLSLPVVNAPNITAATTYTIGQMPLLQEDFHDMLAHGALMTYYTSTVKDAGSFSRFETLYNERLQLLEAYAGTKSINVDLGAAPQMVNPNLFIFGPTSTP